MIDDCPEAISGGLFFIPFFGNHHGSGRCVQSAGIRKFIPKVPGMKSNKIIFSTKRSKEVHIMLKKRLVSMGLVATMVMSMGLTAMASEVTTADTDVTTQEYDLYFVADPTLVNPSGFSYAPVKYTIPAGTAKTTTLMDVLDDNGVERLGSSSYISALPCAQAATFALSEAQIESLGLKDSAYDAEGIVVTPAQVKTGYLAEKEFSGYSGWMMTVDNATTADNGNYYYTMGSTIADMEKYGVLSDGDVVLQMFFSFNMGADIGMGAQNLPTEVIKGDGYSYYNWSFTPEDTSMYVTASSFDRADSTALVEALADTTVSHNRPAYRNGVAVLKNLRSTPDQIAGAISNL